MLYRIIIGNYRSFADYTEFNMFHDPERTMFPKHVYREGLTPLIKACAIYGANGSGKTNFILALEFLIKFVMGGPKSRKADDLKEWYLANRFQLPVQEDKPIEMLIEFETHRGVPSVEGNEEKEGERVAYIYKVEIDLEGVRREELLCSGLGKEPNQVVYERKYEEITFGRVNITDEMRKAFSMQLKEDGCISVLGLSGHIKFVDDPDLRAAFDWFNGWLDVVKITSSLPQLIELYYYDKEMLAFLKTMLKSIGAGIKGTRISKENFSAWLKRNEKMGKSIAHEMQKNEEKRLFLMHKGIPQYTFVKGKVLEFLFRQEGRNGYVGDMDITTQSDGTLRLLAIMPAIYFAYKIGKTILIDEIDNSIHPLLVRKLIQMFADGKSKGQLIFTTHETALLDQEMLRPEEVWFVEKTEGSSVMYSLNEFKVHKAVNIQDGYLEGRFGAIPFIGKL